MGKNALRLVEIQESVLPEDEWIIGISVLDYFNGVGYSMPQTVRSRGEVGKSRESLSGGDMLADGMASSNLEDSLKIATINDESQNLFAFIPGVFYCSSQQTSVDAVLVEVTQKQKFGVTLSSFRPEDVRALDISGGFILDGRGDKKIVDITVDTLGGFHFDDFLKDSGISASELAYSKEIDLAQRLSRHISFEELTKAYASSSFLSNRLMKLLEDIDFYGLTPRQRIYLRNEKHPHGRVMDVIYRGFESIVDLGAERGIVCTDEMQTGHQLNELVFTKQIGPSSETGVESAIMEMLELIEDGLEGQTSKEEVLAKLSQEIDR